MSVVKIFFLISVVSLITGCDKGGGNFSILSASDKFTQDTTYVPRQLDILFVVDNSGSMSSSQTNLATNFPSFINFFKNKGYDFKIAVTTTDAYYGDQFVNSGCGSLCNVEQTRFRSQSTPLTYVINNKTYNLENIFASNVNVGIGGSGDERAFSSFKAALNSTLNTGFHRSGAFLSVIIVSDEEDFSHDDINLNESYTQPTLHSVASYNLYLQNFTSGQASQDFSVSTISVLDDACKTSLGSGRKIGQRYMQLADLTGGSKNSICSNFNAVLDNITTTIASQTAAQFILTKTPKVSSIHVLISGSEVPQDATNGWSYVSSSNAIFIKGSYSPASGEVVTINFDPASIQ